MRIWTGDTTEHYGLPLPPRLREKTWKPEHNDFGQYKVVPPGGTLPAGYSRASTVAETLDDRYLLHRWEMRNLAMGLVVSPNLQFEVGEICDVNDAEGAPPFSKAQKQKLNDIADQAQRVVGSGYAAEFGECVHAWTEYHDHGLCTLRQVPDLVRMWVAAYLRLLAEHAYTSQPQYTERTIWNPYGIVGTLDRVLYGPDGHLVLGDVKTNANLHFSYVSYGIQLAAYHGAAAMMSRAGQWEAPPAWRGDYAVLIHLPSNDPDKSSLITFSMEPCYRLLALAMQVRAERRSKDHVARHTLPVPSPAQAAYFRALYAVQTSHTDAEMAAVWENHRSAWTDDLTALAQTVLANSE